MNQTHRLIYSPVHGAMIAVPETAKSRGKGKNTGSRRSGGHSDILASVAPRLATGATGTTTTRDTINTSTAQGTSIGGNTVSLVAGNNLTAQGASIISDQGTALKAGNDITLTTAQNTRDETHFTDSKKSGFTAMQGGGFNVGYSKNSSATTRSTSATTQTGTTVASIGGDVSIQAGNTYTQTGSDILTPSGNIDLSAKRVEITEARETSQSTSTTTTKSVGISVGLSNAATALAGNTVSMANAAKQTSNARVQALAGAAVALDAYNNAGKAVEALKDPAKNTSVGITLSSSKSTSTQSSTSDTAKGSNLAAGGNVSIKATGGGEQSDIIIQGSSVNAGVNGTGSVTLKADDDLLLLASKDTESSRSSNKSSGASVGVSVGQGGMGVTVGISAGRGKGAGDSTTYNNTSITAGNAVNIDSGNDTTLRGANVAAQQVIANIGTGPSGGNLSIESLQDTATYNSKQQNASGSVTVGAGAGGSVSVSQSKVNSNYQSVGTQSGIATGNDKGDGGFQINVAGTTTLVGGKVTSTDAAVKDDKSEGKNSFTSTGGITTTELANSAAYKASSMSLTVGTSGGGAGVGSASGQAASTTQSGITGVAGSGNANLRTGDAETSIKPIFDKDTVTKDIQAQVQMTQQFGMQASKTIGDEMGKKEKDLKAQANKETDPAKKAELNLEAAKWGEGGAYRIATHAVVGGLTGGNVQGALGAGVSQAAIPVIGEQIAKLDLPVEVKSILIQATGLAIGAATGGVGGAVAAQNATANNYLSSADLRNRQQKIQDCRAKSDPACEVAVLKEYDEKSAKNTAAIDYKSVMTKDDLEKKKADLEKLAAGSDMYCDDNCKAVAKQSIKELDVAINVINKAPLIENTITVAGMALDVYTLGQLARASGLVSGGAAFVKEFFAAKGVVLTEAEAQTLYRAVMDNELKSIQSSGKYSNIQGIENKYFSTSGEGASSYAKQANKSFGDGPFTITKTEMPTNLITPEMKVTVDGGINAVTVPTNLLDYLKKPTILNISPIKP